jgi:hypothetical protein
MRVTIFGIISFAAAVASSPIIPTATLLRTPSFDSAVIQTERNNGAFSYSTVENHAYAPVIQTVSESGVIFRSKVELICVIIVCNVSMDLLPKHLLSSTILSNIYLRAAAIVRARRRRESSFSRIWTDPCRSRGPS